MKTNLMRAALACVALMLLPAAARANSPIIFGIGGHGLASVGVSLTRYATESIPQEGGLTAASPIANVTDSGGQATFKGLAPGNYVLVLDGKDLVAAMDKLAPPAPKKESGGGGLSLGIGGFMGGGSSHRSSGGGGAGPVGGSQPASHRSSSSGGGAMGVSVAVGDVKGDGTPDSAVAGGGGPSQGTQSLMIRLTNVRANANQDVSLETGYCRDSAVHGMRIGFTVPKPPLGAAMSAADSGGIETVVVTAQF